MTAPAKTQSGLVCVATIFSRPELACFVASLESEHIRVSIVGDRHGSVDPIMIALGGYHVMVAAEDMDDAITVIHEAGFNSPDIVYPATLRSRLRMVFLVAIAIIVVVPMPFSGRSEYARRSDGLIALD